MTVKVTYRYPGIKEFQVIEQSGPGPVRNKVFKRMLGGETKTQPMVGWHDI